MENIALYLTMSLPVILIIVVTVLIVVYRKKEAEIKREYTKLLEEEKQKIESGEYEYRTIRVWPDIRKTGIPLDFPQELLVVRKDAPRLKGEWKRFGSKKPEGF